MQSQILGRRRVDSRRRDGTLICDTWYLPGTCFILQSPYPCRAANQSWSSSTRVNRILRDSLSDTLNILWFHLWFWLEPGIHSLYSEILLTAWEVTKTLRIDIVCENEREPIKIAPLWLSPVLIVKLVCEREGWDSQDLFLLKQWRNGHELRTRSSTKTKLYWWERA